MKVIHQYIPVVLLIFLQCCPSVNSQSSADAKALRQKLFVTDGYDKRIRPALDQNRAVDVYVSFNLLAINDLDEVTETLKTTGFLFIEWLDEHLMWNTSDFGGIDADFWPQDDIWKPDVALKNSYKEYKELGTSSLNVMVSHKGHVEWSPFQVFQSTCAINVKYFPYDTQTCYLRFVAWSYTKDQVEMHGGSKGIVLDSYQSDSGWDILDTSWEVELESGEASIKFILKLRRKPMFIILNSLLPVVMLALLNTLAFALPCDCGEKASFAVTVFLAFAVFMTIISSTLPENSDSISVYSIYVVLLTVQSTMITTISLIMVRASSFGDDTEVPKLLVCLISFVKRRPCRRNPKVHVTAEREGNPSDVKKYDLKTINDISLETDENNFKPLWKEAMNALDLTLFVFFTILFVTESIVCFLAAKYQP